MIVNGSDRLYDPLSELGRTTTAYHDAPIDRIEDARQEYLEALRNFNLAQGGTLPVTSGK